MTRYTVTTYNRTTAFYPFGGKIISTRENERDELTGTAEEVTAYLVDTIRENYADEIRDMEQEAREADDAAQWSDAQRMKQDMEEAEEFAAEAVRYAVEDGSDPEEIPMDPEPSLYAEVRKEEARA